jgi:predicted glycoside hydrolase/deacetylase ChbG (UPF0249 family)
MPDLDKKIIISADDFGQSLQANTNIFELLSLKKLHRVSIMIDGFFSPEEIRSLLDSQVKLDLHLDLFNLLKNDRISRKKTGVFGRLLFLFKDYFSGKISVSAVAKNWARQLENFHRIFGRYPDGLNSHEHIHLFPPYFKLIPALAEKKGINYLRLGKKDLIETASLVSLIIYFLRKINRRRFLASGLASSDFLVSLDWLKKNALQKLKNLPYGELN